MASDRKQLRGVVLTEDKRTERFFRRLLDALGFGRFRFYAAPSGQGSAEAWVAAQYPREVRALRSRNFQQALRLIAVRDGDGVGVVARKQQLDKSLRKDGQKARSTGEGIATPVPTRNIETWLLALLGEDDVNEADKKLKRRFERAYADREKQAHWDAAAAWTEIDETSLPSLRDGKVEMERLDP